MTLGNKDRFHFRSIEQKDEKFVRKIIFDLLESYALPLDLEGADADLTDICEHYRDGLFGVITDTASDEIVGSYALYPINSEKLELRKMYIKKAYQGMGLGKYSLDLCEAYAQRKGYEWIILETASVLKTAIKLYEKNGYTLSQDPLHTDRCDIVMSKKIN